MYFEKLKESPFRSVAADFEMLISSRTADEPEAETIMYERFKMSCLLFCLSKINKFGFLESAKVRDIFLAIFKKIKQIGASAKQKVGGISSENLKEIVLDGNSLKQIIQTETDSYHNLYVNFIEDCNKNLRELESNRQLDRDPRNSAIKIELERPFEFNEHFFKKTLLDTVSQLFDAIKQEHSQNSYAQLRHYQIINYILDCMLMDSQVNLFFDPWVKPAEQRYFELIDRLPATDLSNLVRHKFDYV